MKQLLIDLWGSLFQRLLGCDGTASAALLALSMWCGHYALHRYRSRPGELIVLVPVSAASLGGALFVCESALKFLVLLALALLTYAVILKGHGAEHSDGQP